MLGNAQECERMSYGIRIVGLREVQRTLGADITPAIKAATKAIALEVQGEIAPYPPATIANSPSNPKRRWYERGFGPKWVLKNGAVHGRKTSETLGRRWAVKQRGVGAVVGNPASYADVVHDADKQARFHGQRGWVTDKEALMRVIRSGAIQRIVTQAIMGALRRRR